MTNGKSVFRRVIDAMISGREMQARRYIARYAREHEPMNRELTKR
ncbi:hypothetical protein [Devosia aquimaris]|nr:hypothetical protein [Devosia sp. CJK-A8-3]